MRRAELPNILRADRPRCKEALSTFVHKSGGREFGSIMVERARKASNADGPT